MALEARREASYDIVAIAASAGGLEAITTVLKEFAVDFPAPIVIVQHLERHHKSSMVAILANRTELSVQEAVHGTLLRSSNVYIAPPDFHLLVDPDGRIRLTQTELVHFVRPAADVLFESVSASFGDRAIAVVLTGCGFDGAKGVTAIHENGGFVIVQDVQSARHSSMPAAAIKTGCADLILPLEKVGAAISELVAGGE
ncbi:MAG: chemotaxis protein CheB [Candidatus Obscuribacterales bacterium]